MPSDVWPLAKLVDLFNQEGVKNSFLVKKNASEDKRPRQSGYIPLVTQELVFESREVYTQHDSKVDF